MSVIYRLKVLLTLLLHSTRVQPHNFQCAQCNKSPDINIAQYSHCTSFTQPELSLHLFAVPVCKQTPPPLLGGVGLMWSDF